MAKADKIYGGRWRVGDTISEGGQGVVFHANDITRALSGDYALKRVLQATRHERFRAEVEAVKRLDHPNIIKLIDHSALDADAATTETKQFIVMPFAGGGHLAKPDRLALYQNNLDSTIIAALQLAEALIAAHAKNVIHRDVKPQNILFTGHGHNLWLSDFGICLIRDAPRITPDDEVVGPRGFIAPECEDGGKLDVDGRADIYSLGKVIYFMLSGGKIVPREKIGEAQYGALFEQGERHQLLYILLQQMISPLGQRIGAMPEVRDRLLRIQRWEAQALASPLSGAGLSAIEGLRQKSIVRDRVADENAKARAGEASVRSSAKAMVETFLGAELEKVAKDLNSGGALLADVAKLAPDAIERVRLSGGWLEPLGGCALSLAPSATDPNRRHLLQLVLCEERLMTTTVRHGPSKPEDDLRPARDIHFVALAHYGLIADQLASRRPALAGFLSGPRIAGQTRMHDGLTTAQSRPRTITIHRVMKTFYTNVAVKVRFSAGAWPDPADDVRAFVGAASETFFAQVNAESPWIGD
ncbi:MAG: serine/threonine-protein kinase [Terricaulis sp.]